MKKMLNVSDVANFFIVFSKEKMIDKGISEGITNLKLQKLLYFAQAAHLAIYNKELFEEEIEAWEYGPVVKSVYHFYKAYNNKPLPIDNNFDFKKFDSETRDFLKAVWDMLGKYSATELVSITHKHDPWKNTFKKGENHIIDKKLLREYYKGIFVLNKE